MKYLKIDSKGNIITGTTVILIASLILILIFVLTSIYTLENENTDSIANDNLKYIVNDYNRNLEVLSHDSIAEVTEEVYHGKHIFNSEREIKKVLNKKLDDKNKEYEKKYGVSISSDVISIKNTDDPINLEVTTYLTLSKN